MTKVHRFIINGDLSVGKLEIKDSNLLDQLKNVLRIGIGDRIILVDKNSNEGVAEIHGYGKGRVDTEVLELDKNKNEPVKNVSLYCSILKRDNFELVVQKATEIGVKNIIPIISKRTIKIGFKTDRLGKIIKEAAEQSGRGVVPLVSETLEFDDAIKNQNAKTPNIFFDISGEKLGTHKASGDNINIWIGPEGGWDRFEIDAARDNGFRILSLGSLVLRAETAAVVASYLSVNDFI